MTPIEDKIECVVDRILKDYQGDRDIDKIERFHQPDRDVVVTMIEKLRRIIFPGYFWDKNYRVYNAKHNLSMLIEDVMYHLNRQTALVFQSAGETEEQAQEHAQQVSLAFFEQIPNVRTMVQTDLEAAYAGDPAATGMAEIIFAYPGLYAITVYRLAHVLYTLDVPMLPRIMTEYAHSITGIDIHPGATIGKYFFIDHGTGIVVGETTVIGENVKIYQGVTLGALSTRGGQNLRGVRRHPTIEDNVTIYAGASVLGGDTVIGRDSVIGSNAFITKSIAPNTTVSIKNQELQFKGRL
ncbi:MAG: serine acetyltransferase [Oscillospiraceae bacterium]|nr:serine acetyltransferase [Oscillospiraceae bacterium]